MKDVQTQSSFTWSWCVLSTTPHFSPPLSWWFRSDKIDFRLDLFQASEGHFDWRLYFISLTVSEIHSCYLLFVCLFRKEVYWKPWDEGNVFLVSQSQFNITPSQSVRNMQNMTVETFQSVSSFLPHDLLFFCCCCSFAFFFVFFNKLAFCTCSQLQEEGLSLVFTCCHVKSRSLAAFYIFTHQCNVA